MTPERCPRCDRDYCPNFPPVSHDGTEGDRDCSVCVAHRDCSDHAVDWRARAIAAESERDALRAERDVTRSLALDACLRADIANEAGVRSPEMSAAIDAIRKQVEAPDAGVTVRLVLLAEADADPSSRGPEGR